MGQDEIIEGNKLIAKLDDNATSSFDTMFYKPKQNHFLIEDAEYHSSWDWQVPVWSKVARLTQILANKTEHNAQVHLRLCDRYESAIFQNNPALGQSVIVDAIKWYNQNK